MAVHAIHPLCAWRALAKAANHCFLEWKMQRPTWAGVCSVHDPAACRNGRDPTSSRNARYHRAELTGPRSLESSKEGHEKPTLCVCR
jgi:hypothetical protein